MSSLNDVAVLRDAPAKGVVRLRLNRPSKRNALSNKMIAELADHIRACEAEKGCRCVVLSGGDGLFSAGADVSEMRDAGIDAIQNRKRAEDWQVLESTRLPLIASVDGICLGGGHELAMLCDMIVASARARFGQPEVKLGHIPGDGATQRLPRRIGKYAAMQMILTGELIDAEEAQRLGLVNEVTEEGRSDDRAVELAMLVARHSSKALGLAKDAVRAAEELPLSSGLERERRNIALAFTTRDQKEGMTAFFEKRPAEFTDE